MTTAAVMPLDEELERATSGAVPADELAAAVPGRAPG